MICKISLDERMKIENERVKLLELSKPLTIKKKVELQQR